MRVAIDGRAARDGKLQLATGRHLVLAFVRTFSGTTRNGRAVLGSQGISARQSTGTAATPTPGVSSAFPNSPGRATTSCTPHSSEMCPG